MTVPSVQCLREELRKTLQVVMADAMGLAMRMKMAKAGKAAGRPGSAGAARAAAAAGASSAVEEAAGGSGEGLGEGAGLEGATHHVVQAATDMWSVGVLAWECLTGRPLFEDAPDDQVGGFFRVSGVKGPNV